MPQATSAPATRQDIHQATVFLCLKGLRTRRQAERWMKRNPHDPSHATVSQAKKLAFDRNRRG